MESKPDQAIEPISVIQLIPGDRVWKAGRSAVFIQKASHPFYADLELVIWVLQDGTLSLDALAVNQYVGERDPVTDAESRRERLKAAVLGVQYKRVDHA